MTTALRLPSSLLVLVALMPLSAHAHPRDELAQTSYLGVTPREVTVELVFTPGEQLTEAFQKRSQDPTFASEAAAALRLWVDGTLVPLRLQSTTLPLRLSAALPTLAPGPHQLRYENRYAPLKSAYLAAALAGTGGITIGPQTRDARQQQLGFTFTLPAQVPPPSHLPWVVGGLLALSSLYALGRGRRYRP
ncbi:hypothetical protein [Armatimonas rosea]|uniref:CopC domain-containing protein n=1 Tax=Armatimonas rosea TaxID=685828 RepID=A0A7W9W7W1_ARMRO|nr:hypothetical protein [Armatimonas rosea]MBB6051495.1 hypothetical protein [Armatimonas rosea]